MEFEFEKEEQIDEPCPVCNGVGKYGKVNEVCFHCKGKGTTKWPKRCKGDCAACPEEPRNPMFKVGDLFIVDSPGINADGSKGKIVKIKYTPCTGNYYSGEINGVDFGDSDRNMKNRGGPILKKIGHEKQLSQQTLI